MKKIIKFLFKILFLLLLLVIVFSAIIYKMKPKKLPFQEVAKEKLYYSIFPEAAPPVKVDTVLTPDEELAVEFESRKKIIEKREAKLKEEEAKVQAKLDSINTIKRQLESLTQEKSKLEEEKIAKLVKVFESMRATEAANVIAQLDDRIVVKMLTSMNDRQAAKILQELNPQRAAEISQRLTRAR